VITEKKFPGGAIFWGYNLDYIFSKIKTYLFKTLNVKSKVKQSLELYCCCAVTRSRGHAVTRSSSHYPEAHPSTFYKRMRSCTLPHDAAGTYRPPPPCFINARSRARPLFISANEFALISPPNFRHPEKDDATTSVCSLKTKLLSLQTGRGLLSYIHQQVKDIE
jgi:hypothetical protein